MPVSNLTKVVNESFVLRFAGLASGSGGAVTKSNATSTTISTGLRFGAQTFAKAVQGLNAGISFLNISRGTLEKLTEITDKLITLTERSTKISTSADARKGLNLEFKRLASDFQEVVEQAKFGERNVLNVEDISELFTTLGLDRESSESIAAIFKEFSTPDEDEQLASEEVKGTRPYFLPRAAFNNPVSDNSYYLEKITDAPIVGTGLTTIPGGISTVNSVYTATDDILNQNTGNVSLFTQDIGGSLTTLPANSLSTDISLKAVNENTGYSVIQSSENFLGFNASNFNQLFLVDADGTVVHQFTNEASNVSFGGVSISNNDKTIAYSRATGADLTVRTIVAGTIGENPASSTNTLLETLSVSDTVYNMRISNDASYVGYIRIVGGAFTVQLRDVATNTPDAFLAADVSAIGDFDFYENNKIALARNGNDIKLYTAGSGSYVDFLSATSLETFAVLQKTTGSQGYIGYFDNSDNTLRIYGASDSSTVVASHTIGTGDLNYNLSMAFNSSGQVEAMLAAELPSYSGDTGLELYRLKANRAASGATGLARSSAEYETIFDGTIDISTRPMAYRMLHDLKALRKQMQDNSKAIDYATDIIGKNIDLVRAAGFAFLDLSSSVTSEDQADQVASKLRDEIRKNARGALAQAENLQNIVVAALALTDSNILGR
jgi:flagellin-like hook-associated protein FlgL